MRYNRWYTYILFLQVLLVNVMGMVLTTAAQRYVVFQIPYARHYNPLLIRNRS